MLFRTTLALISFFTIASGFVAEQALACPSIAKIPDFNCDAALKITVLGDSLVYGIGDTANDNRGGYPTRAERRLGAVDVINLGKPGAMTGTVLRDLIDAFRGRSNVAMGEAVLSSDIVVLDVGRNDRWLFGLPLAAYRNLKRIRTEILKAAKKNDIGQPLVVTAVLMLPNRGSQGPWVRELNELILSGNSRVAPADLRFDLVSKRLLSADQIHPTPAGYEALASTFVSYVVKVLPPRMRKLKPDQDEDGIFDEFELSKFGTDPTMADTDGDGQSDGREIFVLKTDPLSP